MDILYLDSIKVFTCSFTKTKVRFVNQFVNVNFFSIGCFEKLPVTWRLFQTFRVSKFQELTLDLSFKNWHFLKQYLDFQINTSR